VLVLAHRLSTVARLPRIVLLDGGRIAGDGSLAELVAACPAFATLFADQLAAAGRKAAVAPSAPD
jgi:ATP-binding cassette subfamily B protein